MSFILDALRKSEHERQRQTGPALVETPVAAPATRTNRWATAAIVLLLINLVALGVVLLTKSRGEKEIETSTPQPIVASAPPAASADSTASATSATPAAASPAPPPDESSTQAQASVTRAAPALPPMMRPAGHPPVSSGRNPLREEIASDPTPSADAGLAGAATPPPGPPAVQSRGTVRPGTVVYQSLPEADALVPSPADVQTNEARAASNLPRADELAARMGGPELRLELHVYSTRAAERMVFINSRQYREGDTTQEGALIEQITPDGVVMSMNGRRFLLPRE